MDNDGDCPLHVADDVWQTIVNYVCNVHDQHVGHSTLTLLQHSVKFFT